MKKGAPTDDELATWLGQELAAADGHQSDELAENYRAAMDYYLGRPRGDEEVGQSEVISTDVADMVEAILANMLPCFAGDATVTFEANDEDDEQEATEESDLVSQVIMEDNRGYYVLAEAIKDTLLLKNGCVKAWVETTEDTRRETFEFLTPEELAEATQSSEDTEVEVIHQEATDDGVNATILYTRREERLRVQAVPPENTRIEANFDSVFLDECRFFAERHVLTRSELLEMGFDGDKVAQLASGVDDDESNTMRNLRGRQSETTAHQPAQEKIEVYECYYRVDMTGDGKTELIRAWVAGTDSTQLLSWEPVDFIPYAIGVAIIQPHRFLGFSVYDRVAATQDIKTAALRQWINNASNNNINRAEVVDGAVNMDDASNPRASGLIRVKQPGAYNPIPVNDIGPSMISLLEYSDKMRAERAGASLDLASGEAQLMGQQIGSQGVDRIYSAKEQIASLMTRTLAETLVRSLYLLVHETMRSQMTAKFRFRRAGEWSQTQPASWPKRTRVNIKIGLSPSDRARKQANLQTVIQAQMGMMQQGAGVIVDLERIHAAMMDWARAADLDGAERYWIDPRSEESQQAAQAQAQQAQEAQQKQEQMQQEMVQLQAQLAQAELQQKQLKDVLDNQFKYFEATLRAEIEEAKLIGAVTTDLTGMQDDGRKATGENGAAADGQDG